MQPDSPPTPTPGPTPAEPSQGGRVEIARRIYDAMPFKRALSIRTVGASGSGAAANATVLMPVPWEDLSVAERQPYLAAAGSIAVDLEAKPRPFPSAPQVPVASPIKSDANSTSTDAGPAETRNGFDAALSAGAGAAVPEGRVVVPREPTQEMVEAAYESVDMDDAWQIYDAAQWSKSYRAAINAAPRPAQAPGPRVGEVVAHRAIKLGLEMVAEFSKLISAADYGANELGQTDAWEPVEAVMFDGTMASYRLGFEEIARDAAPPPSDRPGARAPTAPLADLSPRQRVIAGALLAFAGADPTLVNTTAATACAQAVEVDRALDAATPAEGETTGGGRHGPSTAAPAPLAGSADGEAQP